MGKREGALNPSFKAWGAARECPSSRDGDGAWVLHHFVHQEHGKPLMGQLHRNYLGILGGGSLKAFGPGEVPSVPHHITARTCSPVSSEVTPLTLSCETATSPFSYWLPCAVSKSGDPTPAVLHAPWTSTSVQKAGRKSSAESSATSVKITKQRI